MEPVVRFENVTRSYGPHVAVDRLDLTIEPGKFVTLLGPSGCGKSTTLRMLGGFETPNSGRILLAGRDVTHLPPNRRDVNIVFQDYALFPHMTIARNIAFGLEMQGKKSDVIHRRVEELLALVQLESYADRLPAQLSGGQRQRVALMRALAPDPQVLLLDEPLSALDAKLRQQMQIELKAIQEKTGKTFLFVTHDQEEAITMSDQIVVMNKGRIEQIGDPHTLYGRPRSRFVATFIGETNLLDCIVDGADDEMVRLQWQGTPVRAAANGARPKTGDRVQVALRPESIGCSPKRRDGAEQLAGRISQRIFKGNHTALKIEVGAGRQLNVLVDPIASSRLSGDEVWLDWSEEHAVVLQD
ncbi:MAG: ABC transporter ATP-binding protein [Rhizobiales bacterium]|nr:ABC transporter ATP-binding protein [Hyphomicrobiales bacterium]